MVYQGNPEDITRGLIEKYNINAVYVNRSYSPRGKNRDDDILALCDVK